MEKDKIIVTFTTWTKRHDAAAKMLENFKKQTLQPDKIYCWLSSDEYGGENIPDSLKKFVDENYIEVRWVKKNSYVYKRYETFKEHRSDYVICIDDDILYCPTYVQEMYDAAKKLSHCIIVYGTNSCDYRGVKIIKSFSFYVSSHKNLFLGGLNMFPPNTFPMEFFENEDLRDKYVPKCDESWIRSLLIKHNLRVYPVKEQSKCKYDLIDNTQDVALYNDNKKILDNGMREKERFFFSAMKIHNMIDECKKIWPKLDDNFIRTQICI